jgi:hypothetical protein
MSEPSTPPLRLSEPPVEDLFDAVEEIRAADYPAVPADLLTAVLAAERDHLDDRLAATRAVGRTIDAWLAANQSARPPQANRADQTPATNDEGGQS